MLSVREVLAVEYRKGSFFIFTLLISAIAMFVAVPIGLMSAIYMSEYATKKFRDAAKPLMEILAGIPTVVYGYFALTFMTPLLRAMKAFSQPGTCLRKSPMALA